MTQHPTTKILLILFFPIIILTWGFNRGADSHTPIKQNRIFRSPITIEGFSNTIYDGENLISKIEADQFFIAPRKFFVFNVKSVNEAIIKNIRISLYLNSENKKKPDLVSLLKFIPSETGHIKLKNMGYITRGVIKGLDIKIYQDQTPSYHLSGEKAILDLKEKKMKINTARFENFTTGEIFTSERMIWHNQKSQLHIPGKYVLQTPSTQKFGKNTRIAFHFPAHP